MRSILRGLTGGSALALVLTLLGLLFASTNPYREELAVLATTYAFLAVGLYVPLALTGQLSLAYNAYFAIGAYGVLIWSNRTEASVLWAVPIAVAISVVAATLLGLATARLTGFHLAVATLLFGVAARQWIGANDSITGGSVGLSGARTPELFGWQPDRMGQLTVAALSVWAICVAVSRVRRSSVGVALRAQQEAPDAAAATGFPPGTSRVLTLAVGAGIATLGGSTFAFLNGFVLPDSFTISVVFLLLFMPVLGGLGSPWGAALGAVLVIAFTEAFSFAAVPGALSFGVLTLLVLTLAPAGILGGLGIGARFLQSRFRLRERTP